MLLIYYPIVIREVNKYDVNFSTFKVVFNELGKNDTTTNIGYLYKKQFKKIT